MPAVLEYDDVYRFYNDVDNEIMYDHSADATVLLYKLTKKKKILSRENFVLIRLRMFRA